MLFQYSKYADYIFIIMLFIIYRVGVGFLQFPQLPETVHLSNASWDEYTYINW